MEKKIEENDVVYTIDGTNGGCVDIDVKPGVEEVSFEASFGREYLLGDCKKVFPDVRKIVIDYSVYNIDIPNTLFPNVKEVKSDNYYGKYTKNGSVLLKDDYHGQILTNTFAKKADETVDLKYATKIEDDAFSGCMATKIINSGSVVSCAEYAFRNSAIGNLKPEPDGAVVAGSILVNIDESAENIILPDKRVSLTAMRDGINFDNVKSITANRAQTVINLRYKLPVGIKIILRWQVGILGYLIAEMKTSKHTNKQKYRLRLFNFSTLRRREIFIFINEECGIHVRTPCIVLRLIDGRETRPRLYTPTSSSFVSPYGFGTREHSSRYHGFVCQRQKPLGYEREARVIKVFSQKTSPFVLFQHINYVRKSRRFLIWQRRNPYGLIL
jgi:hypothetical protein